MNFNDLINSNIVCDDNVEHTEHNNNYSGGGEDKVSKIEKIEKKEKKDKKTESKKLSPVSTSSTSSDIHCPKLITIPLVLPNTDSTIQDASSSTSLQSSSSTPINPDDKVDIVIKSCKNITSKQALLIIPITNFFSNRPMLNKLINILKGESISLRLIDWFVTNYCKKYNILYNINDFRPHNPNQTQDQIQSFDNFIIIHNNYKGQLKAYSKRNFDPFCRRNRIRFYYEDGKYFITTVGQLNFFKWALENHIVDYIQKNNNLKIIDNDMNLRCETGKKAGTKIKPVQGTQGQIDESITKKNKPMDGIITVETQIKTKKGSSTRKKRKEISTAASKTLSIHNFPTTLIFD